MADTIKEYVIKIRADVEEAQDSINKLKKTFKNININNSVNVDFGDLANKINGHIGNITKGINDLQSSFKEVSTKDISSELKELLTTLNDTMRGLKDSFSGFNEIFKVQEGSGTTGFQHVFDDLKKQLSDMLTSYNDTMETMKKIMSGEIKITPVETGIGAVADNLANEVDGAKQKLGAAQSELETAVSSFLKARDKILKSVGNDKKKYNVNDYNDFTKVLDVLINQAQSFASMGGNLSSTGFSKISETIDGLIELKDQLSQARLDKAGRDLNTAVTTYLNNVEMIIKSVSDSGQGHYSSSDYRSFENMITQLMNQAQAYIDLGGSLDDTKFKKTSETLQSLAKLRAQVVRQYEALTQNTSGQKMLENRRSNRQKNNEVSKIVLPISVEIDESQMSEESIDELVSKIQTNIQNKVQKKLAKNPVKMPLAFSSAISTEGLDEKTAKDVASEFEGSTEEATKGLIKDIQIQVKADTDRLVKEINSKIQQINTSDALAKIQVDVVPKSIDQAGVDQFAQQVETQIRDNLDLEGIEGIPVSGNFNVNTTGLATESTLSEILRILSGFRGKGILINHDNDNTPPGGGGTPPGGVGGGTHIPPHNNPPVGGNIPPKDSGGNAQIPHNNPLDGGPGGTKSAVHGVQGQRSDGPIPVEQVGVVKTEPAKSSVQNVKVQQNPQEQKKPTTKDYFRYTGFSTWHKGATKDYNETASLRKDTYYALQGTRQQQKGLDTLFSFLTRKTSTLEELKDSEVYKSKYVIDKQDYALFGGDRQTLGDFQTFLTTTFEKGKKDIEDGLGEIAKDFSEEALEEKVPFRGSSETLATKREELEKQNGKLNDLLTKEANLKALVGNPKAEINGKTGEEAQIDIQNAILNVQDRIARKKEDIGKLENDLEAYLKAHPEVPKWKDIIGEQLEKERERVLKPAAIQKLVSQGKYKSTAEAEAGVQKDFSDRRSSLLSSSSRTPLYDEQLKGIRTKREADKRKEIADDLLKQSRTQVKGRVKALAENLSLLGAATTDKGELKVNWDDFASNPDQVMLEIRNGLQKIRDEGDKEIKFYADSINGIKDSSEDLKRYIELGSKTRTGDEEAEFSSLQERLKPILSKGAYFAKFSQEISDATSEANRIYEEIAKTGSSSDQDRLPDLERIINGDNAIKETFSAQELVQAAQTSLDKVAEAEAEITKIQKRVRSRQYDFVNRTGEFSAYDDTTKMRKSSPIAVSMNRQTYGAQKALLPKWEKVISEMQVRMLPKEGGGFDTSSLTKPEQQLYYRAMTNVRKLRGGIEAYELINQITHNKPNGGTPVYKSLGLDERASETLFNLPTAQEIKGMNSEQLIQLSKDIQYAIDALKQKQSGELTDQEIQEKAIEQANADIIALDERIKQITAQLEKIGDPGNDRVKARKKRQLEYELEDTKKSKAQLTENEELGVAVRDTDGKWKRIKFSDYQKEKEALDIEDAKIDDDILKALGVKIGKPEVLSEFKRDLLALQVLMENEAEARESYQMAQNDARIKSLNKPYTKDQVDRAKRIMYGDQAEDVSWSEINRDLSRDRQALRADSRWALDVLKGFRNYQSERNIFGEISATKGAKYALAQKRTQDMWEQISTKYGLSGKSFKDLFGEKAYQTTYSISEDAIDQEMDDVIRQNEENVKNGVDKKADTILDKLKKSQIQKIGKLAEIIFTAEARIERTQDFIDQYNANQSKGNVNKENNKVYRKRSIRGYKNPEDFVRYNSELPARDYTNAENLYGKAMPKFIDKQRDKIVGAMQQLRDILPKGTSDEDISRILKSILVSYQPKGKVAKLMERSQRVQEQRNAMEELRSKAEKRGLNGKGVYDERVGVYTERMKENQKQATDTLNSLSETQRVVQQQLPITQKNEQDAAAQAAELQQKQAEVDKLMAMSVSERTEAINAQYDGLIDTLQNDSKAQLDALKKSRRKEKKADKDRVTKAQKRLDEAIALPEEDVEEYVPKTFEDYLGGFKKGIKEKRVKYVEYEGLISEQKDLEQQLSSAKTTDERKDVRNRLLELNKRLSQMKKDMAERIVLDLSRTINNLQDELSTAVDNDEDKVRSISQKLLNTIEDYKNISLKFGVNSSEGKSKNIKGMSAEKYAASVVGSNSKEKKAQAIASAQSSLESAKRSQQLHDEEYDQNVAAVKRNTQAETEYLNARRQSVLAVVDNNAELEKQLKINQGITSNEEDEELAAARGKRTKAREEEREKKRQEKLLGKEEKQKEKTNDQLQAEAYKVRYSQTPTADGKSTLGEQENKKFDHIRKADEERRQRAREAREREIQEQYQDYIDQQQSWPDDGIQDYGDEGYDPNYDLYDQLYNSEEQLAEYRQETANSTDQAIKAEKKVKPSSDDKDAISLSKATSREDYINRVKLGLSRGYHIGSKDHKTAWGESKEFLEKYGYNDFTDFLKKDEVNIAKMADTYYKPLGESTDQMKPSIDGVVDAEGKQIEANNGLTKSAEQAAEAVTKVFPNRPKSRESSDVSTMDLDTVVKELNTGATVKRRRSTSGKTKDLWDSYIKELQDRRHELLSEKKQQQEAKKKEEKASPKSPTKAKTQTGQGEQGITRLISPDYDLSKKTNPDELMAFDDKILEEQLRVVSELQNPSVKNNPKMKAAYEAYTKELTDFSLQVNEKLTAMGFEQTDEGWKMVLQTPDVKPQKDEKPSSKSQQFPKAKEAIQDGAFSYRYNGKVYPVVGKDEKDKIKGRILSSDDLSPLRNVGDTSKLKRRKADAIQRVKEALNAYSATGDKGILEELSKSFRGKYGKNKSLDLNIKEGVQAFISKELGELFVDPRSKQATLDSIKDVYSSGGKEGVRSALSKLTMSSLKKIADHIGYDEKAKGKLEDRFKTNKGVVDYLVGQTEKHYGKTQDQAKATEDAVKKETGATGSADTSGIEQQIGTLEKAEEKAEETKTAVIDLNNALESMKSILSSSGKEGLTDALSKLTAPNLRGILSNPENNLDATKTSRLKKSGLINRIVNGIESQMNAQPITEEPSPAPNTSELEAKAEAYNHVAESAERAAEAEKNEQAIQADRENALQAVIDANEAVDTAKRQYAISSMPLIGKSADEINADAEKLRQAQEQLVDQKAKFQSLFSSNDEMSGWLNSQRISADYKSIFGLTLTQAQNSAAASNQAAAAAENEATKKKEAVEASKEHAAAEQMDADATKNAANAVQNTANAVVGATTSNRRRNKPSLAVKTDTALDTAVSQTAAQTTGDVSAETQAMQSAGEAAGQSAQQKQAFALANGQVASSANTTASAVMSEVQAFERILEVLQKIASLASSLKLDITINGLEGMDAEFMGKFESLKQAIDGIDPEKFNSIGTAFTGMKSAFSKFGEAGVSVFFNDLANGVRDFTNVLNETDISDNFTVIGNMINRISEAGKALNDAVTLLKSSGKEFRSTLGGNSYVNDSELNNQIEEQLKEWKYLSNPQNAVKSVKTQSKVADYQEAKANGAYAPAIEPGQVVWLQDYLDRAKAAKDATDQLIADLNQLGDQGAPAIKALTDAQTQYMNNVALAQVAQQQYGEAMNKYADLVAQKETQLFGAISSEDKNRFQGVYSQMREEFERLKQELISGEKGVKEFDAAVSNLQKTWKQTISVGKGDIIGNFKGDIDSARGKISEYLKSNYKIVTEDVSGGRINSNNIAQFSAQVVDARNKVNDLRISWNTTTGDIAVNSSQAANEFKGKFLSLFTDLQAKSKQLFVYWTATFFNPYRLIGTVKQVVNIVKQYDDALTEMRKVSDESVTSLKQFQVASFDMASSLGTTGLQIQKSTADWLRLGETLEEAQESARVSNLLLNVSEFQNVDSATQALVSASQAYKDLDKIEIVDKLNNIGNNFSVSTDQLATGLQNAAAVLMTQGNDIDEALALLTAGNAITQDISKTSAGIRTISLRISGTEEAKDEIRDMGEDIDDFVVRTRSKTDSIIRNYTAVASNNFEGVSVLDSNGNLRNTYDILLDIAKIYKEIQAEDKQNGTNRAQALVETLGGKTRSNIAASILQNPEMLEDVYKASQNSAGSAMEENLKYLDSISGKLQQLTNSAQKIATLVIDSEGLKTILDIVNALVKGVADLAEKFGGLNIVIASILGIGAQMRGMSLFNYDKKKGFNFGIFEGILSGDKSILQDRMANIMGDAMDLVPEEMLLKDIDNSVINGFSTQLQEQINLVQQAKGEMATFGDVIQNVQHPITGIGGALETAGGALAKFGTALLNIGVSLVATFAVQAIIGGITYILTYEDKLIEKGEEAKKAIADISSSFNEQTSSLNDIQVSLGVEVEEDQNTEDTISNIADKYSKLYSGVNGITNENINLTNDEYQQYLDLCNQLAGQYPSLVKGWDSQGNAILNIGKSADDARNALMSMYEAQKLSANVEIGNNLQNQYLGALTQSKRINKDLKKDRQRLNEIGDLSSYYTLDKSGVVTIRNEDFADVTNGISEVLGGYVISNKLSENESTGEITVQYILPDNLDDETMQSINAHVASAGRNALTNMTTERAELQQRVRAGELQNADLWASVRGSVSSYLSTSESFGKVNESIQSAVLGNLDKIDISNLGDYDTILDFIYGEIISSMDALNEDAQNKLAEAFTLDTSKINRKDYVVEINKMLSDVFGADASKWGKQLGFYDTFDELFAAENAIYAEFGDSLEDAERDAISSMSVDQLFKAKDLLGSKSYKTFQHLWADVIKQVTPKNEGVLSDLFGDENYQKMAEQYESNISSVTGALETLRTQGRLTAEEMAKLQEAFPDFFKSTDDFSLEHISDIGAKQFSEWVERIKSSMKTMTPEMQEAAQMYINNLANSFDFDISEEAMKEAAYSRVKSLGQGTYISEVLNNLKQKYGGNLDREIVFRLALNDELSGPMDEIYSKYDELYSNKRFDGISEKIKNLGRNLTNLQAEGQEMQDVISLRETKGIKTTVKNYNRLLKNNKEQVKNLKVQNDLLKMQQSYVGKESDKWYEIKDQIDSNNSSIRDLISSQYEYGKNISMSAVTNTQNLLSQLQNASSKGHMDSSSLQELISMARGNAEDILTTTTTGSYADPQAIRELYEQYSELGLSIVNTQMAAEQLDFSNNEKEMLRLGKRLDPTIEDINDLHRAMAQNPDNPDYAKIFDLDEENQGILQTITNLQSLEEEILANSSALGQYQAALSSANWSDPMQTIRGGMESADKLYEQGWWGKDDFTTYANLIATNDQLKDKTGWAAIDAYETNREAVKRYLTEDATGVDNWVDDMVSKSKELGEEWATLDEQGNYTFNVQDMEKFATAMGRSTEFAEYMLMAMKDANYDIDISRIDDEFSRTFNNISGTEANAAQQVKNLVTEMQNVALAGGDISQGAEAAGSALMRMREAGVSDDVINSLVEELNLLGEFNGFHIDPKTLEVTTTVDTNEIDEVDENISKPRRLMVEYGVEEDSVKEAHNTIMSHWQGNEENIRYATKALQDYTAEELLAIKHNDGAWSEGEKEIESFAETLGLPLDQVNALIIALEQMGMLKPEVKAEVDTSDAETGVETIREKLAKPFKAIVEVATENESIQNIKEKIKEKFQAGIENVKLELQQKEAEKQYSSIVDATKEIPDAVSDASSNITSAISNGASSVVSAINGGGNNGPSGTNGKPTYSSTTTGQPQYTGASSNTSRTANSSGSTNNGGGTNNTNISTGIPLSSQQIDYFTPIQSVGVEYIPNVQQLEATNEEIEEKPVEEEVELVNKGKGSPLVGDQTTTVTTKTDTSGAMQGVQDLQKIQREMVGTAPTITPMFNLAEVYGGSKNAINAINRIPDSHNTNITATDNASGPAQRIRDTIAGIKDKVVSIVAKVSGETGVSNLASKIAGLASKTVNVVSNFVTNTIHNKLGFGGGTAYSSGTTLGHGYANGTAQDWTVGKDEDALTNEVGQESIVIFCDDIR